MRYVYKIVLIILIVSCNESNTQPAPPPADSIVKKMDSVIAKPVITDSVVWVKDDTALINLSGQILRSLKAKNYKALAALIHPAWGVRLSPYGHVDTLHDKILSAEKLYQLAKSPKKISWGNYDGTGDSIKLSVADYFKKFVFDVDFLTAKDKSINSFVNNDSSFTNLRSAYPSGGFTQFHIPGINPKYSGMDFKTLILVFKKENEKAWLVGVVHDQWRA